MNKYLHKIASESINLRAAFSKAKAFATPKNIGLAAGATGVGLVAGHHIYKRMSPENQHVAKTFAESTAASIPAEAAGIGIGGFIGRKLGHGSDAATATGAYIGSKIGGGLAELGAIKHNAKSRK